MGEKTSRNIGRYQVLNLLGSGGTSTLFLARDPVVERLVAVKILKEGFDADVRERFRRGAHLAGPLDHINIVTTFDVDEHDGQPFIAMEYLEGETLDALIRRREPSSTGRKIQLMDELCAGLQYAHRKGVVHGDINPKHVMVNVDGVVKILNFGTAHLTGMLTGTLNYMSPEQMMGVPDIDARADQFSAGAVFYELLASRQALPGDFDSGTLDRIIQASPEPLLSIDPTLDPAIVAVVNRCLEKSKENRYPDMAAVRRDLAVIQRGVRVNEGDSVGGTAEVSSMRSAEEFSPSARPVDRHELSRRRSERIRIYVDEARQALEAGAFQLALEKSERALLLDADDAEALACREKARAGLDDVVVRQLLTHARDAIDRGALTEAAEVLAVVGTNAEAASLKRDIEEALEARRRAEEEYRLVEARAYEAVQSAREHFADGRHAAAIELLERFSPDPVVDAVLGELRVQREEIDRQNAERQYAARRYAERSTAEAAALERHREAEAQRCAEERRWVLKQADERRQVEQRTHAERTRLREPEPALLPALDDQPRPVAPSSDLSSRSPSTQRGAAAPKPEVAAKPDPAPQSTEPAASKLASPPAAVQIGVSAPRSATRGLVFAARFVAYIQEREAVALQRLRALDPATPTTWRQITMGLTPTGGGRWRDGTPVVVRVFGNHLNVQPPAQSFEWNGSENQANFLVTVADDAPQAGTHLIFEATIEGVPIFFLPMALQLDTSETDRDPLVTTGHPATTAFASYSSQDDALVKQCLSALKHWDPDIDVFIDCLDMRPNESWRQQLEHVIPAKDAFLLFWSVNAMKSEWVAWEIDLAAATRGIDYIRPMPLDTPDDAPPPEKLKHLHFGDRYMAARRTTRWMNQTPQPSALRRLAALPRIAIATLRRAMGN